MAKNAIESYFRTSKMATEKNNKIVYRSEMARIAIKSDFRTSKMSASGHFVKNKKLNSVLI